MKNIALLLIILILNGCGLHRYRTKAWEDKGVIYLEQDEKSHVKVKKNGKSWELEVDNRQKSVMDNIAETVATIAVSSAIETTPNVILKNA